MLIALIPIVVVRSWNNQNRLKYILCLKHNREAVKQIGRLVTCVWCVYVSCGTGLCGVRVCVWGGGGGGLGVGAGGGGGGELGWGWGWVFSLLVSYSCFPLIEFKISNPKIYPMKGIIIWFYITIFFISTFESFVWITQVPICNYIRI